MATGDLHGNLERLRVQLQSIQYPHSFDVQGLKEGIPACILPLVHYALLGYSRHLARFLSANGYELWAKSDLRFMESSLKFLRQEFNYRSALTMAQMFARGYAERKLLFLCDVIQMCKRKHNELLKLVHEKAYIHKGACATSSPFTETKPWERTLRMPEDKANVDATVVPEGTSDTTDSAAQAISLEMEPKLQQRKISLETTMDNNEILAALTGARQDQVIVSSLSSPSTVKPDSDDLSQITHAYLPHVQPPPSSESLRTLRDDDHPYLQQTRPPPSPGPLSVLHDYEHEQLLQAQLPPSFEPMSALHDGAHRAHHPPSPRPSSAAHDSDHPYLLQAQAPPSSRPLSASHDNNHQEQNMVQDYHEELCQKIMEMADRLEARFSMLEDEITKAKETLQEKVVSLEGRVSLLEAVVPHQEIELDKARRKLEHHQGSLNHQENGFDIARWQLQLESSGVHSIPRVPFPENLQTCECEQIMWIPHQQGPAAIVDVNPLFNILNCRHSCGSGMPMPVLDQHSQTIRDISNTHQCMENNLLKLRGESNENLFKAPEKVRHVYPEKKPLSTHRTW